MRSDDDQTTRRKVTRSLDRASVAWLPIIIGSEGREVEKQGLTINGKCLSGHDLLSCSIAFAVGSTFEWGRLAGGVCVRGSCCRVCPVRVWRAYTSIESLRSGLTRSYFLPWYQQILPVAAIVAASGRRSTDARRAQGRRHVQWPPGKLRRMDEHQPAGRHLHVQGR